MGSVDWQGVGGDVLDQLFAAEAPAVDVGERYDIEEAIGAGGQGTVYRARDCQLGRTVAIKIAHDARSGRWLLAEAALLARLSHPAIPAVYDSGHGADGRAFMVMELVVGESLHRVLRRGQLASAARLRILRAIIAAVGHAHQHGILHRDCKPSNVMLRSDGEPLLIDWGLAATGDPRAICGTPCYAAPEQLNGQVADRRSDIYSLGVLIYEVLSGQLPFARVVDDFEEFRRLRAGLGLIPLARVAAQWAPAYQRIIERAMAAQPAARYPRCEDVLHDLDAASSTYRLATGAWLRWALTATVALAVGLGGFAVRRLTLPPPEPLSVSRDGPSWDGPPLTPGLAEPPLSEPALDPEPGLPPRAAAIPLGEEGDHDGDFAEQEQPTLAQDAVVDQERLAPSADDAADDTVEQRPLLPELLLPLDDLLRPED